MQNKYKDHHKFGGKEHVFSTKYVDYVKEDCRLYPKFLDFDDFMENDQHRYQGWFGFITD